MKVTSARAGKGKGKRKGQGKGQGKGQERERERERESTKALAIFFLNRLGQSEKSANYRKSGIECTVNNP